MASDAEICWPEGFMCIGGRPFSWVYSNREEFVQFTLDKMDSPSGLFKQWKNYVIQKQKETDDKKVEVWKGKDENQKSEEDNKETETKIG